MTSVTTGSQLKLLICVGERGVVGCVRAGDWRPSPACRAIQGRSKYLSFVAPITGGLWFSRCLRPCQHWPTRAGRIWESDSQNLCSRYTTITVSTYTNYVIIKTKFHQNEKKIIDNFPFKPKNLLGSISLQ